MWYMSTFIFLIFGIFLLVASFQIDDGIKNYATSSDTIVHANQGIYTIGLLFLTTFVVSMFLKIKYRCDLLNLEGDYLWPTFLFGLGLTLLVLGGIVINKKTNDMDSSVQTYGIGVLLCGLLFLAYPVNLIMKYFKVHEGVQYLGEQAGKGIKYVQGQLNKGLDEARVAGNKAGGLFGGLFSGGKKKQQQEEIELQELKSKCPSGTTRFESECYMRCRTDEFCKDKSIGECQDGFCTKPVA